jgi:hypothetical protein
MISRLPLSLRWTVTNMSVGLPAYRRCYPLDVSLRFLSPKPCTKCILAYSALLNRAILFCFIASLPSEVMWAISDCSLTSVLWRHEAPPHEHTRKFKTLNLQPCKSEIVTNWAIVCLHFMLQIKNFATSYKIHKTLNYQVYVCVFCVCFEMNDSTIQSASYCNTTLPTDQLDSISGYCLTIIISLGVLWAEWAVLPEEAWLPRDEDPRHDV